MQDQVARKVVLTQAMLEDSIDNIRGAVMIAFPQGLPEWDLVRQALEDTEELAGTSVSSADPQYLELVCTFHGPCTFVCSAETGSALS